MRKKYRPDLIYVTVGLKNLLEKTVLEKQNLIEFSIFPWSLSFGFPKGNEKTVQAFLAVNPSVFQECYIFELVDHEQPR